MSIVADRQDNNALLRERSVYAVWDALRAAPRQSRAELAVQTGLSKPTVSSALRALERGGLVRERGRTTGRRGPSASLYEPVPGAAFVLALDIGAHHVRAVAADLEGDVHGEAAADVESRDAEHVLAAVRAVAAGVGDCVFELAVVGAPGVVDPHTGRVHSSPNIAGWEGVQAESILSELLEIEAEIENDVNLAALGELAYGAGRGRSSFAYLSVGSGLGAGLVLDGQLHRGRHGAAGEVGYLAVGPDPGADATASRGPMEKQLSESAIVSLAREIDPSAPDDPRELFDRARVGDSLGRTVVEHTAHALAVCIASVTAVLDLELVLLGGGIGARGDLLLEPVRSATAQLVPYVPEIELGELGDHAVLCGAAAVGSELARRAVVSRCLAAS